MKITNNTKGKAIYFILTSFISFVFILPCLYADDSYLLDQPVKENYRIDDDYSIYYETNEYDTNEYDTYEFDINDSVNKNNKVKSNSSFAQERYNFINGISPGAPSVKPKSSSNAKASSRTSKQNSAPPMSKNNSSKPLANKTQISYNKPVKKPAVRTAPKTNSQTIARDVNEPSPQVNSVVNEYNETVIASNSNVPENYNVNLFAGSTNSPEENKIQKLDKAEYIPENMDRNMQQLSKTGASINSAINTLENIERYKKNRIIRVIDEDMGQYGLGSRVQVDWTGPIEPLMREIAAFAGYNFKVVGMSPAIPVLISSIHDDVEIGDIAREAHLQAKERADIVIYPKNKTIEIRYTELG